MFVYQKGNAINIALKATAPVDNPDVIIKGYNNGAALTVNGNDVITVEDAEEFNGSVYAFQRDNKLNITFHGVKGMNNPEITLDEETLGTIDAVINGTSVTITYDADGFNVANAVAVVNDATETQDVTPVEEPTNTEVVEEDTPEEEPIEE